VNAGHKWGMMTDQEIDWSQNIKKSKNRVMQEHTGNACAVG